MTENRLMDEIRKILEENGISDEDWELVEALYSLHSEASIDFFNTMKGNSDIEEATESRFNHWASKHFKK